MLQGDPVEGQVDDLLAEIRARVAREEKSAYLIIAERGPGSKLAASIGRDLKGKLSLLLYASAGRPARRRAAFTVLNISIAIVIGPTPPGTGVIWETFCASGS